MTKAVIVQPDNDPKVSIDEVGEDFLGDGELLLDVSHSSLNYKDAMALAGNPGIVRISPLIPGIDVVGTVAEGERKGERITVNGAGLGERRHGGYTGALRVPSEPAITIPEAFTDAQAAAIGTAGYTAALSVNAIVEQGVKPEDGPVLVTGATGGVGSIAILLLAGLNYEVTALTGRPEQLGGYLKDLGASEVVGRDVVEKNKPLAKAQFAGVVDSVGSTALASAISQVKWGGTITACGMAQGNDLPASVMPFILRGVKLIGINSVDAPRSMREDAWALLADHVAGGVLDSLTEEVTLETVAEAGTALLGGERHGRTVVRCS